MVEYSFRNLQTDTKPLKAGCYCPPEVVECPVLNGTSHLGFHRPTKARHCLTESTWAGFSVTSGCEQFVAVAERPDLVQQVDCR